MPVMVMTALYWPGSGFSPSASAFFAASFMLTSPLPSASAFPPPEQPASKTAPRLAMMVMRFMSVSPAAFRVA